jgi:uncharacterized membrane-anchored protein YitT (DUF2179 family)
MDNILKNNKPLLEKIKSFALVFLGTLVLAFGTAVFLIPFELVAGGISGIAIVFSDLTGGSVLTVEAAITTLTWASFLLGLFALGKGFALKTLLSSAVYPLFVTLMIESELGNFFLSLLPNVFGTFIAALLGGALVGLGLGLSFYAGGSTGGVDILALVLCKKIPRLRTPTVILAIDSAVILLGAFVIRDIKTTMLGILSAVTAAAVITTIEYRN